MLPRRRHVLAALIGGPLCAAPPAWAVATDLSLACDTTLAPALRRVADAYRGATGVRVFIHATAPALLIPQLQHEIQNDIIVTQRHALDLARRNDLLQSGPDAGWRNRLVLAGLPGAAPDGPVALLAKLPGSAYDEAAILVSLGITASMIAAANSAEIAFLITSGAARTGFLHITDLRADPRLAAIAPVPDAAYPAIVYGAAITRLARRPNPQGFLDFLASPSAAELLTAAGLERVS